MTSQESVELGGRASRCSSPGSSLLAAACGGGGKKSSSTATTTTTSSGGTVAAEDVRELPHRLRHGDGLPRPRPLVHGRGLGDHVERLPEPARVQARQRPRRRDDRAGARRGPAADLVRRQDVHVHAPQGPQVLGRHAGQGERLQVRDQARFPDRLAGRRLLHEHRRRRPVLEDEEGRHLRASPRTTPPGKITIKLAKPQGDFQNILATLFAAPVPAGTPAKDQSTTPIPSTGPYMITSYKPNRQRHDRPEPELPADGGRAGDEPGQDHGARSSRTTRPRCSR